MNHLVLIKEKIQQAKKLSDSQLLETKNLKFINYKTSDFFKKDRKMCKKNLEIKKF